MTPCGAPADGLASLAPAGDALGLAVNASRVYWSNYLQDTAQVLGASLCGGDVITIASSASIHPGGLGLSDTDVYWVDDQSAVTGVFYAPLGEGPPRRWRAARAARPASWSTRRASTGRPTPAARS